GHFRAELGLELVSRRLRVLDRVVQQRPEDDDRIAPLGGLGHEERDLGEMVEVRLLRRTLSALTAMSERREVDHPRHQKEVWGSEWLKGRRHRAKHTASPARGRRLRACPLWADHR